MKVLPCARPGNFFEFFENATAFLLRRTSVFLRTFATFGPLRRVVLLALSFALAFLAFSTMLVTGVMTGGGFLRLCRTVLRALEICKPFL